MAATEDRVGVSGVVIPKLTRFGDLLTDYEIDAIAAHEAYTSGKPRNPVSGLPTLDRELGGAFANGLNVIHGPTGSGKSALVSQIAAECKFPSLIISAEMKPVELLRRHTARVTDTSLTRIKDGSLPPLESIALARRAVALAPYLAIADATRAYASPDWMYQAALAVRGTADKVLVVVDSAHSWARGGPDSELVSEYERLDIALDRLVKLAAQLNCPVLTIAERNRASRTSGGIAASAGSRHFEYWAESVLSLSYEKDSDSPPAPGPTGEVPMILSIEKNRSGGSGKKIHLTFNGTRMRFGELAR